MSEPEHTLTDTDRSGEPVSAASLWIHGPQWDGLPAAAVGKLRFASAEAGTRILVSACDTAARAGCPAVLAPMDGDTWHAYRVVTESDGSPPFAMEPTSGLHDLAALEAAGFVALERYVSSIAPVPPPGLPMPAVPGVTLSSWDGQGAGALLGQLHSLAGGSFADKKFFKALDLEGFKEIYLPLAGRLDPRMVLFAHDEEGCLVGFLLGMPDFLQGPKPTRAILKTYASMRRGVGHLLAWRFHELARELGFSQVVHALMHSANVSLDRSGQHGGEVFRHYALFGKQLGQHA